MNSKNPVERLVLFILCSLAGELSDLSNRTLAFCNDAAHPKIPSEMPRTRLELPASWASIAQDSAQQLCVSVYIPAVSGIRQLYYLTVSKPRNTAYISCRCHRGKARCGRSFPPAAARAALSARRPRPRPWRRRVVPWSRGAPWRAAGAGGAG